MRSRASAVAMIFTISVLSRVTISLGIAEGPSTPHHDVTSTPGKPDSWIEGGLVIICGEVVLPAGDLQLPGRHNLENCLAAAPAAAARGVGRDALAEGLRSFRGVAHRLEQAGMVAGVTYVNDSKATNVEATLTALNAYPERTHLILGGRDKASDYRPIVRACAQGLTARGHACNGDSGVNLTAEGRLSSPWHASDTLPHTHGRTRTLPL